MSQFTSSYYLTDSGRSPVEEFIKLLNRRTRQKFFAGVELLEKFGKKLPEPHAKCIGNDIYELRVRGQEGHIRVLYFFFCQETVIFTNGFVKKTNKTPKKEKQLALSRKKIYFERMKNND